MKDEGDRKRALRAAMVPFGFTRDRSKTEVYRYTGAVNVAHRVVSLALTFPNLEFVQLPIATLLNPEKEAPGVVAHLSASGALCFANNADVVLDRYDIGGTAALCLELAKQGLERALTRKHVQEEIAAEFPQHWQGDRFYYDKICGSRAKIVSLSRKFGAFSLLLSDENAAYRFTTNRLEAANAIKAARSAHVIRTNRLLTFEAKEGPPNKFGEFLNWLDHHVPGQKDAALRAMVSAYPNVCPVFVSAPNGCVGVDVLLPAGVIKSLQRASGLRRRLEQGRIAIRRYSGSRADELFIFGRNMVTETPLVAKRIALVGCGAIGSQLAKLLIHAGAGFSGGRLMLLDKEVLQPGNIGRHFLGPIHVGEFKAPALKDELDKIFPGADMVPVVGDAISHLEGLLDYDLVLDATGEEALSIAINERLILAKMDGLGPDGLFVRLFGNGAAAQAFLVDGIKHACFKCLKPAPNQVMRYDPMRRGQKIVGRVATCGEGAFVPYALTAPVMAAALALQLTLEWNSRDIKHRLLSLQIDAESSVAISPKNPTRSESCPCCAAYADDAKSNSDAR